MQMAEPLEDDTDVVTPFTEQQEAEDFMAALALPRG